MHKTNRVRRTREEWLAELGLAIATMGALCGLISRAAGLW